MSADYDKLLNEVCVRLGFCGSVVNNDPQHVDFFLPKSGPVTADSFADALFEAEGWDPQGPGAHELRPSIRAAFVRHMGSEEIDAQLFN